MIISSLGNLNYCHRPERGSPEIWSCSSSNLCHVLFLNPQPHLSINKSKSKVILVWTIQSKEVHSLGELGKVNQVQKRWETRIP